MPEKPHKTNTAEDRSYCLASESPSRQLFKSRALLRRKEYHYESLQSKDDFMNTGFTIKWNPLVTLKNRKTRLGCKGKKNCRKDETSEIKVWRKIYTKPHYFSNMVETMFRHGHVWLTVEVSADRSSRMNCEVYKAILSAQIQPNTAKLIKASQIHSKQILAQRILQKQPKRFSRQTYGIFFNPSPDFNLTD